MVAPYRLYGADLSPYSVKVRQVLKYKNIQHEWLPRTMARQAEFAHFAKLPLVPVLVGSDDFSQQDSTPIIETLERRYPEPSITPEEPALAFISALLEDYADEWVNKAMFHYRWSYDADRKSAAHRIVAMMLDGADAPNRDEMEASVSERMTQRLHFVGSSETTAPVIEGSYTRLIALLDAHLATRPYLFGGRPAMADFGLAAQLGQLLSDPTPGEIMRSRAPRVAAWIARLENASVEGPFEPLAALEATLSPILREEVAGCYLPWMAANATAAAAGAPVEVHLPGGDFTQAPQKYAARSYMEIRGRHASVASDDDLQRLMEETGCATWLGAQPSDVRASDADDEDMPEPANDADDAGGATGREAVATEMMDPTEDA